MGGTHSIGAAAQRLVGGVLRTLAGLEEAAVLENCVAIRHPGDVVSHRASTPGAAVGSFCPHRVIAMFRRHETYVLEKSFKELSQHAPCLGRHAQHLVVPVDVLAEERLQFE